MYKYNKLFLSLVILLLIIFFVISPQENILATYTGLSIWTRSILPTLLPFLFFTRLLTNLGYISKCNKFISPITTRLYHTSGSSGYVYIMSVLSGYPMGAKLVADLYTAGYIEKEEAIRMTSFTSTSGPLFILGTVGVSMFASMKLGVIVLVSHIIGALLNGLLYRNYHYDKNKDYRTVKIKSIQQDNILEDAMYNSIKSVLLIGGYITIFYLIITMLSNNHILEPLYSGISYLLNLFGLNPEFSYGITNGLIEMTRACIDISTVSSNIKIVAPILTAIISFGGLSVFLQAYTFIKKIGIKISTFFLIKVTQSIISTLVCLIICTI